MSLPKPYYDEDGITIYCGDCREILPLLEPGSVDLVLTDPPYANGTEYASCGDSLADLRTLVSSVFPLVQRVGKRIMLTPGTQHQREWPAPTWTLCWVCSAGTGCGPWGFCCWQPILAYGSDPYLAAALGSRPDTLVKTESSQDIGHPCAKPIGVWQWVLTRGSPLASDLILDPFMGSGTTLVAAKRLGRKAIGIEIEERYCEIAVRRLAQKELAL